MYKLCKDYFCSAISNENLFDIIKAANDTKNEELMSKSAEFIQEQRPEKISFSIRFFDDHNDRVLAAFFTKMYDESKNLIPERKNLYDSLHDKYSSKIKF